MPNCLLGVHDGPKVAMPGDRLVNGAGVSPRQRGRSTIGDLVAGTDGVAQPYLGRVETDAARHLVHLLLHGVGDVVDAGQR